MPCTSRIHHRATDLRRSLPLHLFLSCLLLGISARGAGGEPLPLVLSGDPAPDGNGVFEYFDPSLTVNAHGQVAFVATLTGTQSPPSDTRGVFVADAQSISQRLRSGDPAPDGNGSFTYLAPSQGGLEQIALNDAGVVAFIAELRETSDPPAGFSGIFRADTLGIDQIVRFGDAAPDGNGFFDDVFDPELGVLVSGFAAPGIDAAGGLSFYGHLADTSGGEEVDDRGVFASAGGAPFRLLRVGAMAPGGDGILARVDPAFSSNAPGHVAVHATLASGMVPPFEDDLDRIYVHDGVNFDEVFRSDVLSPDGNGWVSFIGAPGFSGPGATTLVLADSGTVVFQASLQGYTPVNLQYDGGGRLLATDGDTLRLIARQGDLGPGETDFRFTAFHAIDANAQGRIVFSAILEQNGAPPPFQTTGIYLWDGAALQRLVREGDPAPDGNGVFGNLVVPVFLNEGGEVVFSAVLEGTTSPGAGYGIFRVEPNGTVRRVARSGMALAGSTAQFVSYLGDPFQPPVTLAQAGLEALNDAGQVAFLASLTDGRSGVFVIPAPEPGGAALSLAALAGLAALRTHRGLRRRSALA